VIFVNLTPHTIHLPTGPVEPLGVSARCEETTVPVGEIGGVPIVTRHYGEVNNLPPPHQGVYLIVSHMCRVARPDRLDLVSPGDLTRDAAGRITGCTNLVVNSMGGNLDYDTAMWKVDHDAAKRYIEALEAENARLRPLAAVGEAVEGMPVGFGLSHAAQDVWLTWDNRGLDDEVDETCGQTALATLQELAALRAAKAEGNE